ncbi:serine-rich adhesin for platelets-like [Battus philenor]|uniref:serine-rich adhesin for platelets-like n=1 Tax=Battus philenor TaxID=42288 RepID=UPI0035CF537E
MVNTYISFLIFVSGQKGSVWAGKMRITLFVLLAAGAVCANESQERRSKLPYVADALGNTLPPPSNLPATVGSPVNLLTPDRYEFYTFDESGELVKRLMTLEEIQAIVAAGEETEGLVTFANENQPTIAFNFSQPPYTKVHSVVTNVQNVLKAQMEAHKNNPLMQPTLDTPDVSDSWSLILPSIFGNTGVDIVPDKTTGSYITPETETIEVDPSVDYGESFSKEGGSQLYGSSTEVPAENLPNHSEIPPAVSIIQPKPTTTTTTPKPSTTKRPTTTITSTTPKVVTTTTIKPKTTKRTTTTSKPSVRPILANEVPSKHNLKITTAMPTIVSSSKLPLSSTINLDNLQTDTDHHTIQYLNKPTTERGDIQYDPVSTIIPISTVNYITEQTTKVALEAMKENKTQLTSNSKNTATTINLYVTSKVDQVEHATITTSSPRATSEGTYLSHDEGIEKNNSTTITTQSVSPSTSVSSTQSTPLRNSDNQVINKENQTNISVNDDGAVKESESALSLFNVAESMSQIASDLGGTYKPMPTTSNLSEKTKINSMDFESKENLEIDMPSDADNVNENKTNINYNGDDNYIKISTIDPHDKNMPALTMSSEDISDKLNVKTTNRPSLASITTLDPVLSESMGDLLSQVVNESPENNFDSDNVLLQEENSPTTELVMDLTTENNEEEITTETFSGKNEVSSNVIPTNFSFANLEENVSEHNNFSVSKIMNDDVPVKAVANTENYMHISMINKVTAENNPTLLISSTDESHKVKNDVIEETTEKNQASVLKTEVFKSSNFTPPSYKSEIGTNFSKTSEENNFPNKDNLSEEKKLTETNQEEKVPDVVPKVEEFKKKIQKVNIDDKELGSDRNNSWKLIPTVSPSKTQENTKIPKDKLKTDNFNGPEKNNDKNIVLDFSKENQGLELTTKDLGEDISQFTELCNELAFRYWNDITETMDKKRSFVLSPYAITSMLAMIFMGARGATSGEMNDILKLDDMVTFNPHFTLKNISDSIETTPASGVVVSAFIRELYSDRNKGKILTFYKERAQHFYNGHVEEVNFNLISDIIRRRTNLLVKRYSWGKILEYMKTNTIVMQPPLAAFSANIFQTDCSGTSVDGRDGELYFVVSPNVRQRRLVPVPAVVYKSNFLAGYDPVLDATAAALGNTKSIVSTLFVMPGQQGNIVHAEDLEELEKRLLESNPTTPAWNRLLRTLLPRVGLELQIPRFSHQSTFNISSTLKRMGLKDIFEADHADLGGLNGPSKDLHLSDMIQTNTFVTCGEGVIGDQHHIEQYPEIQKRRSARWVVGWDEPRDYQRAFHDPHDVGEAMHLPLHLRPRQARLPARNAQPARLKFDRPFLFFVRHNPSGMLLYVGRYNPRLLP